MFRFITSNLIVQGRCTNQEIADTFHVSTDSVRRWKNKLSGQGAVAFFKEESRHGRSHKLLPGVLPVSRANLISTGVPEEGISEGSIRYAIRPWAVKKKFGADINTSKTRSQRSSEDARAAEGIGIASMRHEERGLAVTGQQDYAPSLFENQESVFNAGALFALPAIISQGLERFFKVFNPLPPGFYALIMLYLSCASWRFAG